MSFIVLRSGAVHDLLWDRAMAKGPAAAICKDLLYNSIINKNARRYCIATTYGRLFSVPGQTRPQRIPATTIHAVILHPWFAILSLLFVDHFSGDRVQCRRARLGIGLCIYALPTTAARVIAQHSSKRSAFLGKIASANAALPFTLKIFLLY